MKDPERLEQIEEILNLLWGGIRLCLRGIAYLAWGRNPSVILQIALAEGITKFDSAQARENGDEDLADKMEQLNRHYKRQQALFKFQERMERRRKELALARGGVSAPVSVGVFSPRVRISDTEGPTK